MLDQADLDLPMVVDKGQMRPLFYSRTFPAWHYGTDLVLSSPWNESRNKAQKTQKKREGGLFCASRAFLRPNGRWPP